MTSPFDQKYMHKDVRDEKVDYAKLRADVEQVCKRWRLNVNDAWMLAKFNPQGAAECYRAIVNSWRP